MDELGFLERDAHRFQEAVLAALRAGCDLALLCNQSLDGGKVLDQVLDSVSEAVVKGQWELNDVSEERRRALLPQSPALPWEVLMRTPAYIAALETLSSLHAD